jgi:hypothetical protein
VKVNKRQVGAFKLLVLPNVLELIEWNGSVCDWDSTITFPTILNFHSIFSFQMFYFILLEIDFNEIASEFNGDGGIGFTFGHIFKIDICDQTDSTA